jgi:hypothetical protein
VTRAIDDRRLRLGLLAASVVMVLVSVAVLVTRGGGDGGSPPQNKAAALVPRTTLAYVHVSTDRDRDSVKQGLALFERFPGANRVRDDLIARFGGTPTGSDASDIGGWLGKEAALAILPTQGERSDVLLALEARDRDKAERYLRSRLGRPAGSVDLRGTTLERHGEFWVAWVGDFVTVGSFDAIVRAAALHAGKGVSLADNEAYRRVSSGLPEDRVVDAYARPAGLRGVLIPRGGLLGFLASVADRQALVAVGGSLRPRDGGGAQATLKALTAVGGPGIAEFDPTLLGSVPADSIAMVDTNAPVTVIPRVLAAAGGVGDVFRRLLADIEKRSGVDLVKQVVPLLSGETVLSVRRGTPAPVFTLVARVRDQAAARERLARLQGPLSRLAPRRGGGQVPAFRTRRVAGIEAFELEARPGLRIVYTVDRGRLIASTNLTGILAAVRTPKPITESETFGKVVNGAPSPVSSLLFLDFSQLLGLGEQSGLADDPGYARFRADLRKIRAIGAASSTEGNLTTAELFLEIS